MRQPAAWAILVVGVVVSLFTWRSLSIDVDDTARGNFESRAAEARNAIETRLRGYQVALRGLQGLYHAGDVDAAAFHRYAGSLGAEARSFSYARRVAGAEKNAYEKAVRRIRPAGERAEYLVLHFVEPLEPNQPGLGLDLLADAARRVPIERARDTGALVASPAFVLVSAPEAGNAVSLRLPVYRRDTPLNSLDARRQAFTGVVSATFLLGDLAGDAVARHRSLALRVLIRDGGEAIFDGGGSAQPGDALLSKASLPVGERVWQLEFSAPRSRFRSPGSAALPWLVLTGGLLISVLLFGLVGSLATSTRRAQRMATAITEDLRRSQADLAESQQRTQKLIETLPNPVYFKGTDGRYLGVNEAWERFFGIPRGR
jgi:CHASE1-domain containing sensor protein